MKMLKIVLFAVCVTALAGCATSGTKDAGGNEPGKPWSETQGGTTGEK